jgi:tRNA(Ile)-lysidine synthase
MSNQLYKKFINNIDKLGLIRPDEKLLLTVSGGIDSISMFNLFLESDFSFAVAHCNFQLRGDESEGDQQFVENLAAKHQVKCFSVRFDTKEYAVKNKISIQMAARELRYNWFEKIATENGFDKISTAHNLNDVVETFLINLTRGSGLKGLSGIKSANGKIIRPLLFASRDEIEEYAGSIDIAYREDSSNSETKYLRNAIRHKIIPEFEKLNPSVLQSVLHSSRIISEASKVLDNRIEDVKNSLIRYNGELKLISISRLKELKISPEFFFEIISEYGFSFDSTVKILESLDNQPGISFYSEKFQLLKDREELIIKELNDLPADDYLLGPEIIFLEHPVRFDIKKFVISDVTEIKKEKQYATFDLEKLKFPLKLRKWHNGDFFYPFGLDGRKKVSDYFTDHKFSIFEKENTWLLVSGNDIIWIVGQRIDNRYKMTEKTKEILQIKLID